MRKIILTAVASMLISSAAYAGSFGVGITGAFVEINGSGTETTTAGSISGGAANTNTRSVDNRVGIPSGYLEYSLDPVSYAGTGITLGVKLTPGSADVSDKVISRTETAQGVSGTDASGSVTRKAQAEVENLINYYLEIPLYQNMYVKLGHTTVDLNTLENSITSSGTYGNTDVDGMNYGLGGKGESGTMIWKIAYEETDFDTINLTSTTSNKIKADLDTEELNFSVGYKF